jgi:hypothetical protein
MASLWVLTITAYSYYLLRCILNVYQVDETRCHRLAAWLWSSCGYTIFSAIENRVVSSEELGTPNIQRSGGCNIQISRAVGAPTQEAAPTPAEVKAAAARAEEEAKKKEKEKAKEAAGVKAATARAVEAVEAEAAARKHKLQTQLGKMVVANMTHRLLLNTNQAMVGCTTIGARHCTAFEVEGDGFCLLRSVCDANSEVGNIREGQDEKCRKLLAAMVERQLSSSEKTHLLILSLQKSLGDYLEEREEEAPERVVTLLMDINSLAESGGIETLSGTARGMHPIPSPPMSSHLIPHHPTPSHPIPSHPHTTTSHPIPPPR